MSAAAGTLHRFVTKIDTTGECWLWTAHVDKNGYARLKSPGKHGEVLYAHRFSYEQFVGPIPDGLTIDHLCRVRHCVNPAHLEPVTSRENMLRGESPGAKAVRRGGCPLGHPYDYTSPRGYRRCRQCDNATARRRYHERRSCAA